MSPRGIDGFGIYFGDNSIDTITHVPLSYINPQVKNPIGNVITDTLNWVPVTGTFVANGTEKYALIGNFLADNAVTTASINTQYYPQNWTDVLIDDVSCIDVDLPADAGLDTICLPGTSVYIGRPRDVGIDEDCTWYQLPNMTTAIDTAAGLWVSPVATTTYVVRQEICGNVKWDTVVVHQTAVGIQSLKFNNQSITVYPVPAKDELTISFMTDGFDKAFTKADILNSLGQLQLQSDLNFNNKKASIIIKELPDGVMS